MSELWLPDLDPARSFVLQAALDDRWFRLWDYFGEGPYAVGQSVKDEAEAHLAEMMERNGDARLIGLAQQDRAFMRGSTHRGPTPFVAERDGVRVAAWRHLEVHVAATASLLRAHSVFDPSESDRTYAAVPGLFAALDKRFLLPITPANVEDMPGSEPYVLYGEHALFTHPHLRPNRELVQDLMTLTDSRDLFVRVAVDPHAVVPREGRQHSVLLDYWYGVRVDAASLDDPHAIGRTRHERPVDRHETAPSPLLAIDVHWSLQDDLKVLEIEETVPRDSYEAAGSLIFNRYLHAIRDWRNRRWIHVDGAVKAHEADRYEATYDAPAGPKGDVLSYRKLWRIDGHTPDADWGRLLGHHFRGNELVIECFGSLLDERTGAV